MKQPWAPLIPSLGVRRKTVPLKISGEFLGCHQIPHRLLDLAGIQALPETRDLSDQPPDTSIFSSSLSVFIHLNLLSLTIVIIPSIHFVKVC